MVNGNLISNKFQTAVLLYALIYLNYKGFGQITSVHLQVSILWLTWNADYCAILHLIRFSWIISLYCFTDWYLNLQCYPMSYVSTFGYHSRLVYIQNIVKIPHLKNECKIRCSLFANWKNEDLNKNINEWFVFVI